MSQSARAEVVALGVVSWRQFAEVDLRLDRRLTVLVGPNGTGKSTLLSLLDLLISRHDRDSDDSPASYADVRSIGSYSLSNGVAVRVNVGVDNEGEEQAFLGSHSATREGPFDRLALGVPGSFHHATKLLFGRRVLKSLFNMLGDMMIPVGGSSGNRAYVLSKQIVTFVGLIQGRHESPIGRVRRHLSEWTVFSNQSGSLLRQTPERLIERIAEAGEDPRQVFDRFCRLFVAIAGTSCGIRRIVAEDDQLVALTETGRFSFDALSHGLALVAMLVWDCVLHDAIHGSALVLIDEPENHLHPGLQRSLMATLVHEFPSIQFVVATHSPFFVGAARESSVCLLSFDEQGWVRSRMLGPNDLDRGGTANDVLREALAITTSRPLWLEDELRVRVAKYASQEPSRELVTTLHEELRSHGQTELLPDALRVLKKMQDERQEQRLQ